MRALETQSMSGHGPEVGRALYLCEAKIGLSAMADHTRVGGFFGDPGDLGPAQPAAGAAATHRHGSATSATSPAISRRRMQGLAGLRPATPYSLPYLGAHPMAPGVIVAAGHGMLGITLAAATATARGRARPPAPRPAWVK